MAVSVSLVYVLIDILQLLLVFLLLVLSRVCFDADFLLAAWHFSHVALNSRHVFSPPSCCFVPQVRTHCTHGEHEHEPYDPHEACEFHSEEDKTNNGKRAACREE